MNGMLWVLLTVVALASQSTEGINATVLSCSFPDGVLCFSVFSKSLVGDDEPSEVSPRNDALNYNGVFHPVHGLTYTTDVNGFAEIRTTMTNLSIGAPPSLADHGRWNAEGNAIVFSSTRDRNPLPNVGWNAVFVASLAANGTLLPAQRLTPTNVSDYSPEFDPSGAWVAVASGEARANGTDIVVFRSCNGTERRTVAVNGGWPTWRDAKTVLFHRSVSADLSEWSIFAVDLASGTETLVVPNGMTPFINCAENPDLMAIATLSAGFRQIALFNFSSGLVTPITTGDTHHYNPSLGALGNVFYHKCRGGTFPNLRRKFTEPSLALDVAVVNGDFPSVSPDGSTIALIDANYYIFYAMSLLDIDGSGRRTVYNTTHAWMTSWVSENYIAFTSGPAFAAADDGSVQVSVWDVANQTRQQITFGDSFNQGYPCFSPDGTQVVFRTSAVLTNHSSNNDDPTPWWWWSASLSASSSSSSSGSLTPGPYHLAIVDFVPDSSADAPSEQRRRPPRPLTEAPADGNCIIGDTHPHWGPDFIVFASDRGHPGRTSLWTILPDGSNLTEIFDHGAHSVHPTTTPGDHRIVFSSTIAKYSMEEVSWPFVFFPTSELFVMDRDGSNVQRLTHDASTNANAFAGPPSLPAVLSSDGLDGNCAYLDSTQPELGDELRASDPALHAAARRHGIGARTGVERKPGKCPFSRLFSR